MNKQGLVQMWDHMRQAHGMAMRVLERIPADKIDAHPIPNMRTPKELMVHLYDTVMRAIPEGVLRGEVTADEAAEKKIVAGLKSRDELLAFTRDSFDRGTRAVEMITDSQLAAMVKTPWGMSLPGAALIGVIRDEFFHHRGQLYAYSRAVGVEPPMMWDFENNAPEYRPKASAQV